MIDTRQLTDEELRRTVMNLIQRELGPDGLIRFFRCSQMAAATRRKIATLG